MVDRLHKWRGNDDATGHGDKRRGLRGPRLFLFGHGVIEVFLL